MSLLSSIGRLAQVGLPQIAAARGAQLQGQQSGNALLMQIQQLQQKAAEDHAMHQATIRHLNAESDKLSNPDAKFQRGAGGQLYNVTDPNKITPVGDAAPRRRAKAEFMVDGKPTQGFADQDGNYYDASGKKVVGEITPYVAAESAKKAPSEIPGTPEWKAAEAYKASLIPRDSYSFPTITGKGGEQILARANTKTGTIEPTSIDAKAGAGAAGGERAGMAAAFLSRLKMGKADFDNGMKFIHNYHGKLSTGEETITPVMMAQKATAETGQNPEAHGLTGALNNALGGFTQGLANTQLAKSHGDYQRYINLLNSMSLAMTEVLPRPTQQILGIERGINTAKAGDGPERIADIQHRLDKAYEYLFSDPEAMLRKGPPAGPGAGAASQGGRTITVNGKTFRVPE